jgi:SAM-dependent methyltransferase
MQQTKPGRIVWGKGDFGAVAPLIWQVGQDLVDAIDVQAGEDVLDIACGTGNAALRAAGRGATVTGLDIVPELLEQGRALADRVGVSVTWVEGDAEELPFDDDSFDVVLSIFGCMFAPDHRRAAAEIARVLRGGGRMGICAWMPEGRTGEMFATIGRHMPAPPEGFEPPPLWGVASHVEEIFAGTGMSIATQRGEVRFAVDSPDAAFDLMTTKFGPILAAREVLEPAGRWEALAGDLRAYYRASFDAEDGLVGEYLLTTGTKS